MSNKRKTNKVHSITFFEAMPDPLSSKFIVKETPKRSEMIDTCPHVLSLKKDPNAPIFRSISTLKEMCAISTQQRNQLLHTLPTDVSDYIQRGHECKICNKWFFSECGESLCRDLQHCVRCSLTDSNWFCLTCGYFSCGRTIPEDKKLPFFQGGNGHALDHFNNTAHPIVCKLKAITSAYADVYCYECEDSVLDPTLLEHLADFGIDMNTLKKTENSLEEIDELTKAPLRDQIRNNPNFIFIPASNYWDTSNTNGSGDGR